MQVFWKRFFLVASLVPCLVKSADSTHGIDCFIADTARIEQSTIGDGCSVDHYSVIRNCKIGNDVIIHPHCVLTNVIIMDGAEIGPFAHLHDGSTVGKKSVVGNFVEATRSEIGDGSKAKHLTYLGDAELGKNVNVGAGTITCNYDGMNKNKTVIKDSAKIGSNSSLVAPITIGENAVTAAGSTLTQNVPANALALGRSLQTNKEGYAPQLLQKNLARKKALEEQKP